MEPVTFRVIGDPVGAVRMTQRGRFNDAAKRYHQFKEHVQWAAIQAGLKLPLYASEFAPVLISSRCVFDKRVHPDPENVQKAICDALFYRARGGDKHVGGRYEPPAYGALAYVEVTVEHIGQQARREDAVQA